MEPSRTTGGHHDSHFSDILIKKLDLGDVDLQYRDVQNSLQNIVKQDPGRARENS